MDYSINLANSILRSQIKLFVVKYMFLFVYIRFLNIDFPKIIVWTINDVTWWQSASDSLWFIKKVSKFLVNFPQRGAVQQRVSGFSHLNEKFKLNWQLEPQQIFDMISELGEKFMQIFYGILVVHDRYRGHYTCQSRNLQLMVRFKS